jgi:hypothetical protein
MRKSCIVFAASAVLLLWVGTAQAVSYGTVTATWAGVDSGTEVHYVHSPGNSANIYVGRYNLNVTLQNTTYPPVVPSSLLGQMDIYCIDTYEWANTGTGTYTVADLADGPAGNGAPAMGPTKAAYLKDLIYHYYNGATTAADKAVFAASVWEIVFEPVGTSWNITTGEMYETGWTSAQLTTASTYLGNLSTHDHGNTAYALISTGAYQDFAISLGGGGNPIPEPLTLLAVGSALAGLAGYIRRRKLA